MRNLVRVETHDATLGPGRAGAQAAVDPAEQRFFCTVDRHGEVALCCVLLGADAAGEEWEVQLPSVEHGAVIKVEYVPDTEEVSILCSDGRIVTVHAEKQMCDVVGDVAGGIRAAAWSPDCEMLTIVSGEGKLIFLTNDYDLLTECDVMGYSSTAPVWIDWRHDGQYLAVLCGDVDKKLHVYSNDGSHHAVSEPGSVHASCYSLSWKCPGDLISTIKRETHTIESYERNGLFRNNAQLQSDPLWIGRALAWDPTGTLLAIESAENRIDIYTRRNYHWYLKQSVHLPELAAWIWHPELELHLITVSFSGRVLLHELYWQVDRDAHGNVCVIGGSKLRFTSFAQGIVPPPSCHREINVSTMVQGHVCHCILSFRWLPKEAWACLFATIDGRTLLIRAGKTLEYVTDVSSYSKPTLVCSGDLVLLYSAELCFHVDSNGSLTQESTFPSELYYASTGHGSCVQYSDKSIEVIDTGFRQSAAKTFQHMEHVLWAEEPVIIALHSAKQLYIKDELVSPYCTSFLCTDRFLLFTVGGPQNVLWILDLNIPIVEAIQGAQRRFVERGASLIAAARHRVILQMPRGNVETIEPRPFLLVHVGLCLREQEYAKALQLLRRARMDLNILVDYNVQRFIDDLPLLLDQVTNVDHLNLVLASLQEGTCIDQHMARCLGQGAQTMVPEAKRDTVCQAMLGALQHVDQQAYATCMITAHLCSSRVDIQKALAVANNIGQLTASQLKPLIQYILYFIDDSDRVFNDALRLGALNVASEVAKLTSKDPQDYRPLLDSFKEIQDDDYRSYSIASHLGDHLVALNDLHRMLHRTNYRSQEYCDEAVQLISQHALFEEALVLFAQSPMESVIGNKYAEHLLNVNPTPARCEKAALLFLTTGRKEQAIRAFQNGLHWKRVLAMLSFDESCDLNEVAAELVEKLEDRGLDQDLQDAGHLYSSYLHDADQAVRAYCAARVYQDALCVCGIHQRQDLITTVIVPSLIEAADKCKLDLQHREKRLAYCTQRLEVLLETDALEDIPVSDHDDVSESNESLLSVFTLSSQSTIHSVQSRGWSTASTLLGDGTKKKKPSKKKRTVRMYEGHPQERPFLEKELRKHAVGKETLDLVARLCEGAMTISANVDTIGLRQLLQRTQAVSEVATAMLS